VFVKGVAGVLLRFPLLLVRPAGNPGVALFLCAAAPPALLGILSSFIMLGRSAWSSLRSPLPSSTRAAVRFASVNYLGQLAVQGPTLILPLIAVENVSNRDYASFYVAFSVATVVFLIPLTIGQVLLTEGGLRGADLRAQTRLALRLALGVAALATLACVPGSRLITAAYGPSYQKAADLLIPLVAAALAWCVTTMYLTEARVMEDSPGTVAISVSFFVATLLPALVLASVFGLTGVTVSWLVGNVVAMATAIVVHRRASRYPPISWWAWYAARPTSHPT
jgi:O-antigen/teichoic acid export membrane protein